jgi:uncharacterized protein
LPNPVVFFEIAGRDGERLRPFYQELFGWSFAPSDSDGYSMLDTGPGGLRGALHEEQHGPVETLVYVQVPDLRGALESAERLGGKTIVPPTESAGQRRIAQFEDPEGNIIGLVEG